jgi:hypothetical protein
MLCNELPSEVDFLFPGSTFTTYLINDKLYGQVFKVYNTTIYHTAR